MEDIELCLAQVAIIQGAITGVTKAFDHVPDNVALPGPVVVNVIDSGEIKSPRFGSIREQTFRVKMQLLVALQVQPADAEKVARPFIKRFVDSFDLKKTLNSTCETSDITSWTYGRMQLRAGDQEPVYVGVAFTLEILTIRRAAAIFAA